MENDLIRRSELKRYINHVSSHWLCEWDTLGVLAAVDSIPAVDAVPVMRCRECVHWERYDNTAGCGYCHKVKFEYGADGYVFNPVREPDFYCADGRKADV